MPLVQELAIGKLDGREYEMFKELSHITPAADGGVFFFDEGASTVRRFDSTGAYLNSLGRHGEGPGEYTSAWKIDLMPDGNVLIEADKTLNLYRATGESIVDRDISFTEPQTLGSQRAVTEDGFIHVSRRMYDGRYPDSVGTNNNRVSATVVHRLRIDSPAVDTIYQPKPRVQPKRFEMKVRGATVPQYRDIPLSPRFVLAYSSLGYWIAGGEDTTYTILLHRREGGLLRIESDLARVESMAEEREWHFRSLLRYAKRFAGAALPDLSLIPASKPHFTEIQTDVDGRIWVRLYQPGVREEVDTLAAPSRPTGSAIFYYDGGSGVMIGGREPPGPRETTRWMEPLVYDVFAPTGEFLGRIRLPARSSFGNARGNRLWLIATDDYEVPTLVRFRVEALTGNTTEGLQ
jgi:hypothetical protein